MNNICYYYSIVTGEVVKIIKEDIPTLFNYQIPLLDKPKSSCKYCYGRGYEYKNDTGDFYPPCRCIQKLIDSKHFKDDSINLQLPKLKASSNFSG